MRENIGALVGCVVPGILEPSSGGSMLLRGIVPSWTTLSELADDAAELCRAIVEETASLAASNEISWMELLDSSCRSSLLRFVPCREPTAPSTNHQCLSLACWKRQRQPGRAGRCGLTGFWARLLGVAWITAPYIELVAEGADRELPVTGESGIQLLPSSQRHDMMRRSTRRIQGSLPFYLAPGKWQPTVSTMILSLRHLECSPLASITGQSSGCGARLGPSASGGRRSPCVSRGCVLFRHSAWLWI
jgi:hypothetical protein